jgi:hypothetical protein
MRAAPLVAGLTLALLLALRIDAPWRFIHDDNGAFVQGLASAHLRAGLDHTRGQGFFLRRVDGGLVPYLHHPPLFPLAVAAAYRLTGRSDPLVTRLVPAGFHLAGLAGLFLLGRMLFPTSPVTTALALGVFAIVPMSAYFGKMPNHEATALCWVIWALVLTESYRGRPRRAALLGAVTLWTLACFTAWGAYPILGAITGLFLIEAISEKRPGARRAALALGLTFAASVMLVLGQIAWAGAGLGAAGIFEAADSWAVHRQGLKRVARDLGVAIDFHRNYFANIPFLFYVAWLATRARALLFRVKRPISEPTRLVLAGSLACIGLIFLFPRAIAVHAYNQFWFLPFESLAVAELAVEGWDRLARRPALRRSLAALAVAGTLVSSTGFLYYRYTRAHGYAVRTARAIAGSYYTFP